MHTLATLRRTSSPATLGGLAACMLLSGCDDGPAEPAPTPVPRISIAAGDDQVGAAGLPLPAPPTVVVTDVRGAPLPGVEVVWRALEGGGWAEPDRTTTGSEGRAETRWTLGSDFGRHLLYASVDSAPGVTFRAWADLYFTSVSAGWRHTCGLDATGLAWCWGDNTWGQLGDGSRTASAASRRVAGNRTFARVLAGRLHTCALSAEGEAFCWGDNGLGQLADGTNTNRPAPVPAGAGARFRSLALGGVHACGLDEAGALLCWGGNAQGQLGVASPDRCSVFGVDEPCAKRPTPVPLPGSVAAAKVAAGENHTCALGADGRAWCWGRNDWGQLGVGRFGGNTTTPTEVVVGRRFRDVAAGPTNTCALDEAGAAWCWGMAARGVLGMDTLTANRDRPSPVTMPAGVAFLEIGVGDANACARAEGGVWCWGAWTGNASAAPSRVPVRVGDAFAPATLSVGGSHACAFAAGVWCWGANAYGQLGVTKDSVPAAPAPLLVRRSPPR